MDNKKLIDDAKHVLFSKGNVFTKKAADLFSLCKKIRDNETTDQRKIDEARTRIFLCRKQLDELTDLIDRIESDVQPSLFDITIEQEVVTDGDTETDQE